MAILEQFHIHLEYFSSLIFLAARRSEENGFRRQPHLQYKLFRTSSAPSIVQPLYTASTHPCPICCTSRVAPVRIVLAEVQHRKSYGQNATGCRSIYYCRCSPAPFPESVPRFHAKTRLISVHCLPTDRRKRLRTFGRLTLGTMTLCSALGASFGGFFGSPPGWYWYLKCSLASAPFELSVCHGILPAAMLTFVSDVEEVGLRPERVN